MHGVYSDDTFEFDISDRVELLSCARHSRVVVERVEVSNGRVFFDLRYAGAPAAAAAAAREPRWLYSQWALAAQPDGSLAGEAIEAGSTTAVRLVPGRRPHTTKRWPPPSTWRHAPSLPEVAVTTTARLYIVGPIVPDRGERMRMCLEANGRRDHALLPVPESLRWIRDLPE